MNPFIFTGVGALVAAGMAAVKQNNINSRQQNANGGGGSAIIAEKAKLYTGADVVQFNKIQSAIDSYITTTYGKNPTFDEQIIAEKTQIFDYCVTSSGAIKGGATYENFTFDPYTTGHENVNSSYPKQTPSTPLTSAEIVQNAILDFIKPFANGNVDQLWRLIDNFYKPSGGDEKSKLDDSSNAWILNGTKMKLFIWVRDSKGITDISYSDFDKYKYPGLTIIIQAWQKKERGLIGQLMDFINSHSAEILAEIEKLLKK